MRRMFGILILGFALFVQSGTIHAQAVVQDCNRDGVVNGLDLIEAGCGEDATDSVVCGTGTVEVDGVCIPDETGEAEFAYSGDIGPGFWGELSADWEACSMDTHQSPIDLTNAQEDATLGPLALDLRGTPLHLINNGHTIEQEYEAGSTLIFNGLVYELDQFHFHTLSEHAKEGQRGDMELHAVFSNAETGTLAVIGLLYGIGAESGFLAQFPDTLPAMDGDVVEAQTEIDLGEAFENTSAYYTYDGSLTTPRCSPIVTWIVAGRNRRNVRGHSFVPSEILWATIFVLFKERNDRVVRKTPAGSS